MDGDNVQVQEPASTTEPVSQPAATPEEKVEQKQAQPLTEDRVKQLIADATQQALQHGKELGKREMQSIKDREVAEAKYRARQAEIERQGMESGIGELDEDTKLRIEVAKYRARDKYQQDSTREEQAKQAVMQAYDSFNTNMSQYITDLGLDPAKIDFGDETEPLLTKQQRILGQVGKIQKEVLKAEKESVNRMVTEAVSKKYRELGLDSVDESSPATAKPEYAGIPTKVEEFRQWLARMPQKEYEDKYADKVNRMRRDGLIK